MKLFCLGCFLLGLVPLGVTAANVPNPPGETNRPALHIVTCREDVDLDRLLNEHRVAPERRYSALKGFAASLPAAALQRLKADPRVLFVEPDGPVSLCMQTNSTGLVRMGVPQFPVARINGISEPIDVDVAVIDSGINPHPDLNIVNVYSVVSFDGNDEIGHGTGVAGILGAVDNGFGVVGVAPGVRLWNVKVIDYTHNLWSFATSGMDYVLQNSNRISVANISLGNEGTLAPYGALQIMTRKLVRAGIVVVAAAGNRTNDMAGVDGIFGNGDDALPAAVPNAMAVSAMIPTNDTFTPFSNFNQVARTNGYISGESNYVFSPGGAIDVAAPGYDVLTTSTNGGYAYRSGTSMAAPHVAGLVALYIAANGRATNAEGVYRIRQAIIDASLRQSQWNTTNTLDPDTNPEPLAIATEAWVPMPKINKPTGAPGNFQLTFDAVPGYDYSLEAASDLNSLITWTNLSTLTGTGKVATVSVSDTNAGNPRFFRLSRNPAP